MSKTTTQMSKENFDKFLAHFSNLLEQTLKTPKYAKYEDDITKTRLVWDKHHEKYTIVKDEFKPLPPRLSFREVLERNLTPEIKSNLVYGVREQLKTKTSKVRDAQNQFIQDTQKLQDAINYNVYREAMIKQQAQQQEQEPKQETKEPQGGKTDGL